MTRPSRLLPLVNLVFLVAVAIAFAAEHGGWRGDASQDNGLSDVVTGDDGLVAFNKWRFVADRETVFTKAFIIVNAPAFGVAKLLIGSLKSFIGEFESPFPFGISYASYTIALGFLLSLVQWFGIGALWERLQERFWRDGPVTV